VNTIFDHPYYKPGYHDYNFSLFKLSTAIALDQVTKATIGLPEIDEPIGIGEAVIASGWGLTQNENESPRYLREATLFTASNEECGELWKKKTVTITDQMVCADAADKDICDVS
jgi:hypothetical protein